MAGMDGFRRNGISQKSTDYNIIIVHNING